MKKTLLSLIALILSVCCMAQDDKPTFPFQGGSQIMTRFFNDSLKVSPIIKQMKASGVVVFKFSADDKGVVKNLVIYYADDAILAPPLIDAIKKSSRKWIIPFKEKQHDFVIPFLVRFNAPENVDRDTQTAMINFYNTRKPILARDQTPLDMATLLPTVIVNYSNDK